MSKEEIKQIVSQLFGEHAEEAYLTLNGENGGWNPTVPDNKNNDGTLDRGLFQINSNTFNDFFRRKSKLLQANGINSYEDMYDPTKNAVMARIIYNEQGWNAWYGSPVEQRQGRPDEELLINRPVKLTKETQPIASPTPTPEDNRILGEQIVNGQQQEEGNQLSQPSYSSVLKAKKIVQAKDTLKMLIENGSTVNRDNWNSMFGDVMPYSDMMVENEKISQKNASISKDWSSKNPSWLPLAKILTSPFNPKPVMGAENTPQQTQQQVEDLNMGFLENAKVTQNYGEKTFSFYGKGGHEGTDFRASIGTPVKGFAGWVVDFAGQGEGYYGNKVVLRNPKTGEAVEFAHLSDIGVRKGDVVSSGQVIAKTGNSGYRPDGQTQQAHLHVNYYTPDNKKGNLSKAAKSAEEGFPMAASFQSAYNKAKQITQNIVKPKEVMAAEEQTPATTQTTTPTTQGNQLYLASSKVPTVKKETSTVTPPSWYTGTQGTYQVRAGDNLTRLAQQYKTSVDDFVRQNPSISNPNQIRTGQVINIPISADTKKDGYVIKSGDTLGAIAKRLGTTVSDIAKKNNISNPNLIRAGETIKI